MRKLLAILCAFNAIMWIFAGAKENQPLCAVCATLYACTMALILAMDSERKDGDGMTEIELTLDSPITEEQLDAIVDVDFDHTNRIWFHTKHGKQVEFVKAKPVTSNADRIRAMSDEELAKFIERSDCPPHDGICDRDNIACSKCWLDWLKSPAGGDKNE